MRLEHSLFPAFAAALLVAACPVCSSAAAERPNVIFILADDMGYGDVRALNPESTIPTPSLDRLAGEGMTFTDAHSPSAVCTPTRYGVLTGRYCWRSRLKRGVLNGYSRPLIDPARETVASFMKKNGYQTGIFGKWHLGLGFAAAEGDKKNQFDYSKPLTSTPNNNGFSESHIIPASLDFPPYVYIHNRSVTDPEMVTQEGRKFPSYLRKGPRSKALVMQDVLDYFADKVDAWIRKRAAAKGEPFFLYYPLTAPHKPVLPHPRFTGKTKLGPYGDFVAQVDHTVGRVLAILDETGLARNTLVIYTSDNGSFMYRHESESGGDHVSDSSVQAYFPRHHRANGKLRGTKADVWEAGHRVPFLARWPGHIKPGSRSRATICHVDLFATCADLIGAELPPGAAEDSFSLLPLFQEKTPDRPRAPVINHSAAGIFAIREGRWKLVLGNGSGGREKPRGRPFAKPWALFDLSQDPSERHNVIAQHTEIAARLEKACLKIRDSGRSRP